MTTFLTFTIIGIVSGSIYAITATGLVVTYTTTGVFNFAHGAVAMFAAFSYWQMTQSWMWSTWVSLILVLFVEAPLLALLVEQGYMKRIYGATVVRSLMVSLGLLLILVGLAQTIWQPENRTLPEFFANSGVNIGDVTITYHQIICVVVAIVMLSLIHI